MTSIRRGLLAAVLALAIAPATATAEPTVLGTIDCAPQDGVRFCPGSVNTRIASFDGQPLDVNVTLPATGDRGLPLIVLVHGWGGRKAGLGESRKWAERGYAVLHATARGFGDSCGSPASRLADPAACARGHVRLDDTRYEVRDVQHLAGLLVDEGLVDPERIGVHGGSYGGGVSLALALLSDRVMRPDGSYAPWTSPKGVPMRLAAAAPSIPWSDLVSSLLPNGRHLDYALATPGQSREPAGVMKRTYVSGLFAAGAASGLYAPPGTDPDADLASWNTRINAGEPYDDPYAVDLRDEIYDHHSGISIERDRIPAPIFISNGFTDDLFPVDEALRIANLIAADHPSAHVAQMHFDYGHARGQNKKADMEAYRARVDAWMDHYVLGRGPRPADDVTVRTITCPAGAPSVEFRAPTWDAVSPGEVAQSFAGTETVSGAGDPGVGRAIDPIAGGGACATTSSADQPGTATYRMDAATGDGYTITGSPTVAADLAPVGTFPQLAARLWDVPADGGPQTLIARGLYRVTDAGEQVFQLHPTAYRIAPGHQVKLELLTADEPYGRASNGAFTVAVRDLELRLPVAGRDGDAPRAPVVPGGAALVPSVAVGPVQISTRYRRRARGVCGGARIRLTGRGLRDLRSASVRIGAREVGTRTRAPWTFRIRPARHATRPRATITLVRSSGARKTVVRRLRRC